MHKIGEKRVLCGDRIVLLSPDLACFAGRV